MRGRTLICIAVTAITATPAFARDDEQSWTSVNVSGHLARRVQASADLIARFGDESDGLYQIVASGMLGYDVARGVTLWAGYAHAPNYRDGRRTFTEQRAREQLSAVVARVGPATLALRLRAEQRWRDTAPGTGWRIRPQLKLSIPIGRGFTAFGSGEPFYDFNRTAFQQHGFDRLRSAAGIGIPLFGQTKLEIGYLNQRIRIRGGADESDHVLTTALSLGF